MAAKTRAKPVPAGSRRARQITAVVIEAFAGEVGTTEAAERLGISLSRYYQLEGRALAGMIAALEPRPRGRAHTPEREIKALQAEKKELEKELRRHQALLRAAHRTVGLPAKKKGAASSGRRGRRKRKDRGRTVLETLREEAPEGASDGKALRDGDAGGAAAEEPTGA